MEKVVKFVGAAVLFVSALFLLIPLSAIFGYLAGLVIKLVFGGVVASGLNLLFGTSRFTPDTIPYVCAAMGVIGAYLRTTTTIKKE